MNLPIFALCIFEDTLIKLTKQSYVGAQAVSCNKVLRVLIDGGRKCICKKIKQEKETVYNVMVLLSLYSDSR